MDSPAANSPKSCLYCGKNPVAHGLTWYFESINIFFTPLRQFLLNSWAANFLQAGLQRTGLFLKLVKLLVFPRVLAFQKQRSLCNIPRAEVLWQEAEKRGIEFAELRLFGKALDSYYVRKGQRELVFTGLPRLAGQSLSALDVLDDKILLKRKLQQANLPIALGESPIFFWQAKKIFRRLQKPVIVKPRTGSRGRHSTTFVYTEQQLKTAFQVAKQLCFWVMVEEQLFGPVYRATLIDFKLCGVLRGDSPEVVGDGMHNIFQLVERKNQNAPELVAKVIIDPAMKEFLQRQNYSPKMVPKLGQKIALSEKIGISYGGSSSEDLEICHPDNKGLFVKAARVLGDKIVGLDFIIPDITKSYKDQRCGFIEANSLPFINLHHHPLRGRPQNVAAAVWNMMGM